MGFVPDRNGALMEGRVALAEAVSSTNSVLLKRSDLSGMRGALEFIVDRNPDLNAIELHRASDNSRVFFGLVEGEGNYSTYVNEAYDNQAEEQGVLTSLTGGSIVTVPLLRGDDAWGSMHFQFGVFKTMSWLDKLRNSAFSLMAFIGFVSFPMFYFYLGKMLKELNPSTAVPARVRSALDTIAESLLVLDGRSNVVLANAAFADLNGKPADDLLGLNADALPWMQQDDENPSFPWEQAFATGEPTRMDMVGYVDKNGEERKFIVNCSPVMGAKGKVGGVLISMDDVTLLEEKELLLRQSMEEAEAANHAKTAFLSNMSHEIRTPMTAILGFTEVLKRGLDPSEIDRQRHLTTISNSGTHLLELINDVLDLSKVESGAMEVETIPCKAAFISNEVAHVLKVKAQEKGIDLKVEVESDLPSHIISDPSRLRQIVTNLVGNAIKFTQKGCVTVALEYKPDDVDPRMLIKVSDTGIGMNEKQLSSIFEAFIQADASITRRFGGTGLGLSISRKLALAMEGDIVVTSVEGEGSTFMLTVPVGDISNYPMLTKEQVFASFKEVESQSAKEWTFPVCRALVVDDGPENRELLSVVLSELGIEIDTAENGKEGLDAVMRESYDVILMDIQMPVMDGYEAVSAMRKNGIALPIIALTANAMKGYEQKVLGAGFSHYMTKPIDLDRLTGLLAELLGGTFTEVDEVVFDQNAKTKQPSIASDVLGNGVGNPIYSTMAQQNPKFEAIAKQFVVRLKEQLAVMHECLNSGNFEELAKLAHWLKGSGGTVGFKEFAEPAKGLEYASKRNDAEAARNMLAVISNLQSLIRFESDGEGETISENVTHLAEQSHLKVQSAFDSESTAEQVATSDSKEAVFSSLPMDNPRFRDIVEKFIPRLNDQLVEIRTAKDTNNYAELAKLAHWLKGSGGNVGFDGFTQLATSIEESAEAHDEHQVAAGVAAIERYAERVNQGWSTLSSMEKSA